MSTMRTTCLLIGTLLILSAVVVSGAAAKQLQITSATGDFGTEIYLICNESDQLCGYNLRIAWDPAIMNVTAVTNEGVSGILSLNPTPPVETGSFRVNYITHSVNAANQTLIKLICNAKVFDGSSTTVYIDTAYDLREIDELVEGLPADVWDQYTVVNGKFTTPDHTLPTITITTPADGSTVSQTVNVAATITDVVGVDESSIRVFIGGVEVTNPTIVPIANGYSVTAQQKDVPAGSNVPVQVRAKDLAGNENSATHIVNVARTDITLTSPANGVYTNEAQPTILANFVMMDPGTVRMFINENDVTASCDLAGSAIYGSIALNYARYGALPDGAYRVVVNGTSTLVPGQVESDEVSFVKDTIPPTVTITRILDSDYDGFPEAGEWLYVYYTAIDANLGDVWFDNGCNTTGIRDGFVIANILTGNKEMVAYAEDRAGNIGNSTPVHIYNNNLAYFDDPSLGSFAGLDLTKTALYDTFSTARDFNLSGPNAQMTMPNIGRLDKTIITDSNVTLDNRRSDPIPAGSLPGTAGIYTSPSGTLDFAASVSNVTSATLMIARADSALIDQLIKSPAQGALTPGMLKDLLDSKKIVLYGKEGYAIINVDDNSFESVGIIQVTPGNLPKTIRANYVDLNAGFNTATTPYGSTPLQISKLGQGEYALLAVCMDDDRFAIIAATSFTVTEAAGMLSTTAGTYTIGDPVVVNSAQAGEVLSAVVLNSAVTYTGNVTLEFTTHGKETFKSAYLFAYGNQTVVKPYSKADLWLTDGYGSAGTERNTTSINIPTHNLHPGKYRVYMFLEDEDSVASYSETAITLTTTTLVANFTASTTAGPAPLTVRFADTSAGNPTSWSWSFGDGATSTEQNPTHTYTAPGNYTVSLTATNSAGSDTTTRTGYITVVPEPGQGILWSVPLSITSGTFSQVLTLGLAESATREFDTGLDIPIPPDPPGARKSVYFTCADPTFGELVTDYRPPIDTTNPEESWTLSIRSDEPVQIAWDTVRLSDSELILTWDDGTNTIAMRTANGTTLPAGNYSIAISASIAGQMDLPLQAGWNLVSTPFSNATYTVPEDPIVAIYGYNTSARRYEIVSRIESFVPGKAYWIASDRNCTVTVTGAPASPITAELKSGWNLIGNTASRNTFANIIIIPADSWATPFMHKYNPQTKGYIQVTELQPGEGYWGAVVQDCTITLP